MRNLMTNTNMPFVHPVLLILLSIPAALLYMVIYNFFDGSSALDTILQQNSPMFGVNDMRDYRYTISLMPVLLLSASIGYWGMGYLLQNKLMRLSVALILAAIITWASYYIMGILDFALNFGR